MKPNSLTYNFVEVSERILRVLRFEASVDNVYFTNQCQTTFAQGGGGVKSVCRGDGKCKDFLPLRPRIGIRQC
jgi:hypothetical protein